MGKFEITKRTNGEFQFNLKASNGQVILTSEGYVQASSCENGIESVRKNAQIDSRFEKKAATNGKFFFNLKASNGQIIGRSQMYTTEVARQRGIESVRRNALKAYVLNKTV